MRRLLLLAIACACVAPATAAASDPPAPIVDQAELEASAQRVCTDRPKACRKGHPIAGFESTLSFSPFGEEGAKTWHVDWAATFARAANVLRLRPDHAQLTVLHEALRYARTRVDAPLVFLQLQRGISCAGPGCGQGPMHELTPAVSGFSHAAALRAFVNAYERTGEPVFAQVVGDVLRVFELDVDRGGVRARGVSGNHFLMYSYDPRSFVFNGHAAAFASLAQTAAASSLGDVADRAWAAARDAYGELADLFVKSAECRPIAYNVVREIDGTLRQDRIEDRRHRNEVSIPMLRLAATQLTEGMLKGTVDLDAARPMVTYLKGAADVLAKTGKLPPESDEDCVRGWAPGWATRIVSFAEQVHRPNRIGFGGPGVRGFTRKLTWRGWGSRVATATGAARVCPNMERCRIYPVRIRADHRTATVCDGKPVWLYERLRLRIRAAGRLITLPAAAGGGCA